MSLINFPSVATSTTANATTRGLAPSYEVVTVTSGVTFSNTGTPASYEFTFVRIGAAVMCRFKCATVTVTAGSLGVTMSTPVPSSMRPTADTMYPGTTGFVNTQIWIRSTGVIFINGAPQSNVFYAASSNFPNMNSPDFGNNYLDFTWLV